MIQLFLAVMEEQSDRDLISDIYRQYYGLMYYVVKDYVNDKATIEDVIHDSIIRMIHHISTIRKLDCYKRRAYIVKVCKSVSLDRIRKVSKEIAFEDLHENIFDTLQSDENVETEVMLGESRQSWINWIRALPTRQQHLLFAKYYLELNDREISELLQIKEQNVRVYIGRARKQLEKIILQNNETEEDKQDETR